MNAARLIYRTWQFWHTLRSSVPAEELALASTVLSPSQLALFQQMQVSEQAHSLRVFSSLVQQGEEDLDLLTAALLHDAGKTRVPLRAWERALIVLMGAICPGCVRRWGATVPGKPPIQAGWRRAFIVAVQHPEWGAELVAGCGASPRTVNLIRRHQEKLAADDAGGVVESSYEALLLHKLRSADDDS
jgi:hypothetical protein